MFTTLSVLEDLVEAYEEKRPAQGDIEVTHHVTEACFGIAESHNIGSQWVELPIENREMYIYHV